MGVDIGRATTRAPSPRPLSARPYDTTVRVGSFQYLKCIGGKPSQYISCIASKMYHPVWGTGSRSHPSQALRRPKKDQLQAIWCYGQIIIVHSILITTKLGGFSRAALIIHHLCCSLNQ